MIIKVNNNNNNNDDDDVQNSALNIYYGCVYNIVKYTIMKGWRTVHFGWRTVQTPASMRAIH